MDESKKSFLLLLLNQYKIPIAIIGTGLIIVLCMIFAFNSFGKDYVSKIIEDLIQSQIKTIEERYTQELKIRDQQITELQNRIANSEKTYNNLKKRVGDVETRIKERKVPTSSTEIRDRFNNLGFPPIN